MSLFSEFKAFAVKGNAIDLAVGVIIGAAFGKIVDSLVGDELVDLGLHLFNLALGTGLEERYVFALLSNLSL